MRSFEDIYLIAAERKGGTDQLEQLLSKPLPEQKLAQRGDSAWLEAMAKAIFQAGFNWTLIENKWPSFCEAFDGFDIPTVAHYGEDAMERLLSDKAIVRNGAKIAAVISNAQFLDRITQEHGSASTYFATWPAEEFHGLLEFLAKDGVRLGGVTGQRVCRMVGKDGYVLSRDVCSRLIAEGVIDKAPTSKKAMSMVQTSFNQWRGESGRTLTEISQILAMSVD